MKLTVVDRERLPAAAVTETVPEPLFGWGLGGMSGLEHATAPNQRASPRTAPTTLAPRRGSFLRPVAHTPRMPKAIASQARGNDELGCRAANADELAEIVTVVLPDVPPALVLAGFRAHVTPVREV